jgi:hypothetical protein
MDFGIKRKETHHNFMSNLCSDTREQEEIKMMNVENRVGMISELVYAGKKANVRNLTAEISELIYFATHPEEEGEN